MPRRDTHDFIEYQITGKVTGISPIMDSASEQFGSHHREFFHSIEEVIVIANENAKPPFTIEDWVMAGIIHMELDNAFELTQRKMLHQSGSYPRRVTPTYGKTKKY